jgi:UDP-glucose 6-dehydrogenase
LRISIFGLGYVGAVSAGCLAHEGHQVIGVDPVPAKVEMINRGHSPIVEVNIAELIEQAVTAFWPQTILPERSMTPISLSCALAHPARQMAIWI